MKYIYDLEVYPNFFVGIFKTPGKNEHKVFIYWEKGKDIIDERKELIAFLNTKPKLIGFNNISYDSQILNYILNTPEFNTQDLKNFSNFVIESKWPPISEQLLSTNEIDLYRIWHYNNSAKSTSLKWLEFMFLMKSIKDLPYDHTKPVKLISQVDKIITYCKHDLKVTENLFDKSISRLQQRQSISKKMGENLMNYSDTALGEYLVLKSLTEELNITIKELKSQRTQRKEIKVKEIIFPYYKNLPVTKYIREEYFEKLEVKSNRDPSTKNLVFDFKSVPDFKYDWDNIKVVYGMGGIHGCVEKGVYESTDQDVIMSCDVSSEYPNIIIQNNLYPLHLGPGFTTVYKGVLDERKKYSKDTHYMENQLYKLAANSVYGKLNSQYSPLYDPKIATTITVNGQLSKTMLAEMLKIRIPDSKLLMMNTDGLEIVINKNYINDYYEVCSEWEKITNLNLEHDEYKKLIIDDVNNYIGIFKNNKIKRKGRFYVLSDYEKFEEFHKNSSASIIPEAINEYFEKGISIDDTINNCDDIFKFCYGAKKNRNFIHVLITADDDKKISIVKNNDRVLRYYASNSDSSGSLFKMWDDLRITSLQKDVRVNFAQSLRSPNASKYPDLNRSWYISEAYKIVSKIENVTEL